MIGNKGKFLPTTLGLHVPSQGLKTFQEHLNKEIYERAQTDSLCTEMYEILHKQAHQDELNFYLSYAEKGKNILEPLCGVADSLSPLWNEAFISAEWICREKCWKS